MRDNKREIVLKNELCLRFSSLIVIDEAGTNLGVMPARQALTKARALALDLLIVANPPTGLPTAKICDYGKQQYDKNKKPKASKPKELKTLTLRSYTAEHDLDTIIRKAKKFLEEGHQVKFEVRLRGREMDNLDPAKTRLEYLRTELEDKIKIEVGTKLEGRSIFLIVAPK